MHQLGIHKIYTAHQNINHQLRSQQSDRFSFCLSQHIIKCYWIKTHCCSLLFIFSFVVCCFLRVFDWIHCQSSTAELWGQWWVALHSFSFACGELCERRVTGFNLLSPLLVSLWCISREVWSQLAITGQNYTPPPLGRIFALHLPGSLFCFRYTSVIFSFSCALHQNSQLQSTHHLMSLLAVSAERHLLQAQIQSLTAVFRLYVH